MSVTQIGKFLIHVKEYKEKYAIHIVDSQFREGFYGELPISELVNGAISLELSQNQYISESIRAITTTDGLPDFLCKHKVFSVSSPIDHSFNDSRW